MKKRDIIIAVIVIAFGVTYNAFRTGDIRFYSGCSSESRSLLDRRHPVSFPQEDIRYEAGSVKILKINNPAGDIEVAKSTDGTIRIKPVIVVYHRSKNKAEDIAKDVKTTSRVTDEKAVIGIDFERNRLYRRVRIRFQCFIPEDVELELKNRYGNVDVKDVGRNINVDERYGDLFIKNIDSLLTVKSHSGRVRIYDITGAVQLHSNHSRVKIRNVPSLKAKGLHAKFYINGVKEDVEFTHAGHSRIEIENAGPVDIDAQHTRIKIKDVRNNITIKNSHSPIYLEGVRGNVNIEARDCRLGLADVVSDNMVIKDSYSYVDMENVSGKTLDVLLNNGELRVDFDRFDEKINIKTKGADVALNYPESLKPAFNITSKNGKINNRTDAQLTIDKEHGKHTLNTMDGTPQIVIDTEYGDVLLKHSKARPAAPAVPAEKEKTPPVPAEKTETKTAEAEKTETNG